PDRRWTPTYSAWDDELPSWLPKTAIASVTRTPAAWTTRRQAIERTYCVLNTSALQDALSVAAARIVSGTAARVTSTEVTLVDGTHLRGKAVIDARGTAGLAGLAEQTAFGVIVEGATGEPLLEGTGAWFMDWRRDNGTQSTDTPSFLYAVALGPDSILLEETCLVGRPALGYRELQSRLTTRLTNRGVTLTGGETVERVRFPVQAPPRTAADRGTIRFGARSSTMHPATGYSVAASLCATDGLVDALVAGRRVGTLSIWTVQRLRNLGLRTALGLDPELVPHFFASFFDLPATLQKSYLSGRSDAAGTAHAMTSMFPTLPTAARIAIARTLVRS
ncbi:MAG: lycopene cyclase family protein, partial [Rhodococcus sp. (in: high G+C Gram-positive bacteria)]